MELLSILSLAILSFSGGATGFKITRIVGPSVVVNGTVPVLVLDCEYDASKYDTTGLTVKWYFKNRIRTQVYQWIPFTPPQGLNILKGRLDLNYRTSNHSHEMYRALAIKHPTTLHTGDYTCAVSTFLDDDFKSKKVIVYAPASDIFVTYTKPTVDSVRVLCIASGLYPKPSLELYRSGSNVESSKMQSKFDSVFVESSTYNVSVETTIEDSELQDETVFECRLTIPGTDYRLRDNILYYPGVAAMESTSSTAARLAVQHRSPSLLLSLLLSAVITSHF